jgi:colicin import membrane protein
MMTDVKEDSDLFFKIIVASAAIHFSILIIVALKATLFPSENIVAESAIRVDIVGLPEKMESLPQTAPPIPTPPTPVPPSAAPQPVQPAPAPKVAQPKSQAAPEPKKINLSKKTRAEALSKIKKIEQEQEKQKLLDSIKNDVEAEEKQKARQAKISQLIKGNRINAGTALHGIAKAEMAEYISQIQGQVQGHWNLPEWMLNANLKAVVTIFIDEQGRVTRRFIKRSSGDQRFDDFAVRAVDESVPFPPPPPKFLDLVGTEGISLGFPQ